MSAAPGKRSGGTRATVHSIDVPLEEPMTRILSRGQRGRAARTTDNRLVRLPTSPGEALASARESTTPGVSPVDSGVDTVLLVSPGIPTRSGSLVLRGLC